MDDKVNIFWLDANNVAELIQSIDVGEFPYKILNSKTQKYTIFKHKEVYIAWPTINNKIYHNIGQNEYFRESENLRGSLFKSNLKMLNETILFPCVLDLHIQSLSPIQFVFDWYNPYILNYPMRIAITGDPEEFVADKIDYEYVVVDGVAHIEYIPEECGKLVDSIPEHYWTLRNYKLNQKLDGWQY